MKWIYLFVAGGIGTLLRYALSCAMAKTGTPQVLSGTLLVNIIGCCIIGFVASYTHRVHYAGMLPLYITTGFCGGFTTFSAFGVETMQMLQSGDIRSAVLYILASLCGGLLAVFAGYHLQQQC